MEHVRFTLATVAIAVFGLVVAARSLHSGPDALHAGPMSPAVAVAPVAWTDPPARAAAPETTGALHARVPMNPLPSAMPAPQRVAVVPPGAMPVPPLPGEMAGSAEPVRTKAAHRPKGSERTAHRSPRLRQAALARHAAIDRAVDRAAVAPASPHSLQAAPVSKIDPIGDILRGLGFGRDS